MVIGCLRLSDASVISHVVNHVGRRRKFVEVSCTECTGQGNDFTLTQAVKIENRNSIEGYFGSEFLAICNHYGVMMA